MRRTVLVWKDAKTLSLWKGYEGKKKEQGSKANKGREAKANGETLYQR